MVYQHIMFWAAQAWLLLVAMIPGAGVDKVGSMNRTALRMLLGLMLLLPVMGVLPGQALAQASRPESTASWWQPSAGLSWTIQFSGEIDTGLPVDVYDLDGFDTSAETVAMLQERGSRVLCYISTGTWEDWRPDAGQFPQDIIGNSWDEWDGERFLDIRQLDVLAPLLEARIEMCRDKGFDGIEPDNIDTFQNGEDVTGFDLTRQDQVRFNRWLAGAAHERGLAIGQKNIPELTADLLDAFDFAVTEDCFADDWCEDITDYIGQDKPVFAIEYTDRMPDLAAFCPDAAALGFSVILKHRELDGFRQDCGDTAPPVLATGCDGLAGYFGEIGDLVRENRGMQLIPGSASTIRSLSTAERDVVATSLTALLDDVQGIHPPAPAAAWHAAYIRQIGWYRDLALAQDEAAWQGLINNDRRIARDVSVAVLAGQSACGAVWNEAFALAFEG